MLISHYTEYNKQLYKNNDFRQTWAFLSKHSIWLQPVD